MWDCCLPPSLLCWLRPMHLLETSRGQGRACDGSWATRMRTCASMHAPLSCVHTQAVMMCLCSAHPSVSAASAVTARGAPLNRKSSFFTRTHPLTDQMTASRSLHTASQIMVASTGSCLAAARFGLAPSVKKVCVMNDHAETHACMHRQRVDM